MTTNIEDLYNRAHSAIMGVFEDESVSENETDLNLEKLEDLIDELRRSLDTD